MTIIIEDNAEPKDGTRCPHLKLLKRIFETPPYRTPAEEPAQPEDDNPIHQLSPEGKMLSYNEILEMTIEHAKLYLNSNPGMPSAALNISITSSLSFLLRWNKRPHVGSLMKTFHKLEYRLGIIEAATHYKNQLGLDMPDCRFSRDYPPSLSKPPSWTDESIRELSIPKRLFAGGRYWYTKGPRYLTSCLLKSGWDLETMKEKLEGLVTYQPEQHKTLNAEHVF